MGSDWAWSNWFQWKLRKSHFFLERFIIHRQVKPDRWRKKEKTQRYNTWLPVALIKHVHYCMSSHQSPLSAHQTLAAFCQKNCLMNEPLPEDPTSDSLRTLYLWQIVAVVILPILLHAVFDIQMRVSSRSSAHLWVFFFLFCFFLFCSLLYIFFFFSLPLSADYLCLTQRPITPPRASAAK